MHHVNLAPMPVRQGTGPIPLFAPPSMSDVVVVVSGGVGAWAWWARRRARRRKAEEDARREAQRRETMFALRDEALALLIRTQAAMLRMMAGRPCFAGGGHEACAKADTSAEVRVQAEIAVLIHDLATLGQRFDSALPREVA